MKHPQLHHGESSPQWLERFFSSLVTHFCWHDLALIPSSWHHLSQTLENSPTINESILRSHPLKCRRAHLKKHVEAPIIIYPLAASNIVHQIPSCLLTHLHDTHRWNISIKWQHQAKALTPWAPNGSVTSKWTCPNRQDVIHISLFPHRTHLSCYIVTVSYLPRHVWWVPTCCVEEWCASTVMLPGQSEEVWSRKATHQP